MTDSSSTIQSAANVSLGAGVTTGLFPLITQNATAISVLCTLAFGFIYASCTIWNTVNNHRRANGIAKRRIVDDIVDNAIERGASHDVIAEIREAARHKDY